MSTSITEFVIGYNELFLAFWHSEMHLSALLTLFWISTSILAAPQDLCPCGYGSNGNVFTDIQETDFTIIDNLLGPLSGWQLQEYTIPANPQADQPFARATSRNNVIPTKDGVQLVVHPASDGVVYGAELVTARSDIRYGSFRVGMKGTSVSGTCAAFFWVSQTSLVHSGVITFQITNIWLPKPTVLQRRTRN